MNAFVDALRKFNVTSEQRVKDVLVNVGIELKRSVVDGSELTGAPGQPVALELGGELKESWIDRYTPTTYTLTTNVPHGVFIEAGENSRGLFDPARGAPRSNVGGYHSVALTVASYEDRIVPFAVLKSIGGNTDRVFNA